MCVHNSDSSGRKDQSRYCHDFVCEWEILKSGTLCIASDEEARLIPRKSYSSPLPCITGSLYEA